MGEIAEVAMGFEQHGDIAAFGVLAQLKQARADAFDRSLLRAVASRNPIAEDPDIRRLEAMGEVDVALGLVELGGANGRNRLVGGSRRPGRRYSGGALPNAASFRRGGCQRTRGVWSGPAPPWSPRSSMAA